MKSHARHASLRMHVGSVRAGACCGCRQFVDFGSLWARCVACLACKLLACCDAGSQATAQQEQHSAAHPAALSCRQQYQKFSQDRGQGGSSQGGPRGPVAMAGWRKGVLLACAALAGALLVDTGLLKIRMPHPAHESFFELWPPEAPFLSKPPESHLLNSLLQQYAVRLFEGQMHFVETVAVDRATGRLLLPDKWGDVHEALLQPDGSYALNPLPIAQLGPGRVLGSKVDGDGNLVMCDVLKGLLRLNTSSHALEQLTGRVSAADAHSPGSPIFYANSLDIAPNGSIYFSSSTDILPARARDGSYDTGFAWVLNNFRGLPRGRVLVYHPHTRETRVVAGGFYYSDGVAVSEDGSYLLVVETDALRVVKVWLTGDKAGSREVLVGSLPGLPAGLSKSDDGNFWVSMTVPNPPYSKRLGPPLLRALIAWSPRSWRPPVKVWGAVIKVSPSGKILSLLLDPTGARVATASAATEHKGRLFLGSIMGGPFISLVELSQVQPYLDAQAAAGDAGSSSGSSSGGAPPPVEGLSPDSWHEVGGWSLHEQNDLWGEQAAGRTVKLL